MPIGRMVLWVSLGVGLSCGASYAVCVSTQSIVLTGAVLIATFAITLAPVMRWWHRAARAAGVPKTEVTASRLVTATLALLAILVCSALEVAVAGATHSLLAEALVAFAGAAVAAVITGKSIAAMPNANRPSADLLRFSAIVSCVSVLVFSAYLWLELHGPPSPNDSAVHRFITAGYLLLVPLNAINAYRFWRRFLALVRFRQRSESA